MRATLIIVQRNVRLWERILRYIIGILLLTWAIAGGPHWAFVGIYFIATASFGSCFIYWIFRINSPT